MADPYSIWLCWWSIKQSKRKKAILLYKCQSIVQMERASLTGDPYVVWCGWQELNPRPLGS